MYIISYNIMYKDDRKVILTESPYLFANENLREILNEIRKIIKEDFLSISSQMNIPPTTLSLGMTTITKHNDETYMHFFEVDSKNVRELNDALLGI